MKNAPTPRKPSAACFEPSEASETFSGAFLSFPRPRKRSAARFRAFRGLGNVQRRVFELSDASETFSGAFSHFPRRRKPSAACFEPSDASETFSGAFLSFPTRRKRSAARFDTFRGVGNVQRRVLTLSEASGRLGTRVGAYCIRPPDAPVRGGYTSPGMIIHPCGMFGGAYSIRPYTGTCIVTCAGYVHSGTRPNSPASADAPGQIRRCPQTPGSMLWASSRRPTRGERRRRRGLRAARSAGC